MTDSRRILVTAALPYANGLAHMGHLVEYIQTDIWVRFQRMLGNDCLFVCASDAHGTPIMIRARKDGHRGGRDHRTLPPRFQEDFAAFHIRFDNFGSTHSSENRELVEPDLRAPASGGHSAEPDHPPGLRRKGRHVPARPFRAWHLSSLRHGRSIRRQLRVLRRNLCAVGTGGSDIDPVRYAAR